MTVSLGVLCTPWKDHEVTELALDARRYLKIGDGLQLTRANAMVLRRLLTRWIDELDVAAARRRNADRERGNDGH